MPAFSDLSNALLTLCNFIYKICVAGLVFPKLQIRGVSTYLLQ